MTENETAGLTFSDGDKEISQLEVIEDGSGNYMVALTSEPTADVTVTITPGPGDVTVQSGSLTFTALNWSAAQQVVVLAAEDDDAKTDPAVTLTHSASGGDYGSVTGALTVAVLEHDPPGKPVNFRATAGDSQVTLSWNDPQNPDISGWEFQQAVRGASFGTWTPIPDSAAATTSHTVTGLTNGVSYSFKLRAVAQLRESLRGEKEDTEGVSSDEISALPRRLGKNVTLFVSDAQIEEGQAGTTPVLIRLVLGEPAPAGGLGLAFEVDGTSTATASAPVATSCSAPNPMDADMCWPRGARVLVPAGQDVAVHQVAVRGDRAIEPNETLVLNVVPGVDGWTGDSATITIVDDEVAPAAPTGLAAEARNGQALLTWDDLGNPDITRWEFQQKEGSGGSYGAWTAIPGSGAATTSHTVTGLTNGTEYGFKVRAVSPRGNGAESAEATVTPGAVPAAPTGFRATPGDAQLELFWDAAPGNSGILRWEVRFRKDSEDYQQPWAPIPGGAATTELGPLTAENGVVYIYQLRAVNAAGPGEAAELTVKPLPPLPGKPTALKATAGNAQVALAWDHPIIAPPNERKYELQRKQGASGSYGAWKRVDIRLVDLGRFKYEAHHVVTGLTNGATYSFRVRELNEAGAGPASDEVTVTLPAVVPAAPTGVRAIASNRQVLLRWDNPNNPGITRWEFQGKEGASVSYGPWAPIPGSDASTTSHRVTGLTNDTIYAFKVRAVNATGNGAESSEVTATPVALPAPPSGFRATPDHRSVILTWDDPKDSSITRWQVRFLPETEEFQDANSNWLDIRGSGATTTRHEVGRLPSGQIHRFQVRAVSNAGVGPASDEALAGPADPGVTVSTSSLTVEEGGSGEYTVKLNTSPLGRQVVITVAGASGELSAAPATLTFTGTNWMEAQTVTVTLAEDGDAQTDAAQTLTHSARGGGYDRVDIASVTVTLAENDPPLKPANLRAIAGNGQVMLRWDDPENPDITGWEFAQKTGDGSYGGFTAISGSDAETTSHTVTGLTDGTRYGFKVRAVSAVGYGAESDEATATAGRPSLSVADVTAAEDGTFTFTVTLDPAAPADVTFKYAVTAESGDTATADTDFTEVAATAATISAGDTTFTFTVTVADDKLDEDDETFTVTLSEPSANVQPGDAAATGTITDNDASPVLADIDNLTLRLGRTVDITATATDADAGDTITYAWTRKDGETTPPLPGSPDLGQARLSFTPTEAGVYTMTVTASDGDSNGNKHGNTDTGEVVITVVGKAAVSVPAALSVTEGTDTNATVTVTTEEAFGEDVTFDVSYGGASATGATNAADGDYDNDAVTSVTFSGADTTKTIAIPLNDDGLDEDDETFTVTIALAEGSALPAGFAPGNLTTTVTIVDNDHSPVLPDYPPTGTTRVGQAVDLSAEATDEDGDAITYVWTRKAGETTPPLPHDTNLNQAQLLFTPTETGAYTMTVTASDPYGNTDTATVALTVVRAHVVSAPAALSVTEGTDVNATVTVTTEAAFGEDVTFNVTYGGASATGAADPANGDYENDAVTSVTFSSAETTKDIAIPITDDDLDEDDETFTVTVALPEGASLPAGFAPRQPRDDGDDRRRRPLAGAGGDCGPDGHAGAMTSTSPRPQPTRTGTR